MTEANSPRVGELLVYTLRNRFSATNPIREAVLNSSGKDWMMHTFAVKAKIKAIKSQKKNIT